MGLINQSQDYKDVWITENNVKKIIEKTEKLGFITPALVATKKKYTGQLQRKWQPYLSIKIT